MYLADNVYFVEGIKGATIYDFNSEILYHLSVDAKILLKKILGSDKYALNENEYEFISQLQKKHLVTDKYVAPHDITDLKRDNSIDFVWIEITSGCNLQCIHCYDEASASKTKIMSCLDFCHIIDELETNNIRKLQIIGGEPFILGDSLKKYLNYCIGKFDYLEIFTNGTLLNKEWMQYFKKHNICIALSVYSYIESEHNRITQNAYSYRKTNDSIQQLHDMGIKYRVKNVLMANLNQGEKNTSLYELSQKRDIVRMAGRANFSLLDEALIRKKLITYKNFSGKVNKEFVIRMVSGHNCFSRRLYFSVDSEVYPCVMERRLSHGNLKNNSLKNLIKKDILYHGKDKIDGCCVCEFRYSCFDCRPDAMDENIYSQPWYCTYKPNEGTWHDVDDFILKIQKKYNIYS